MSNLLYILSGADEKAGGGVLLCRTDGGLPEKVKLFPLTGPMYMELSGGRLDVVFRRGGGTVGVFGDVVSNHLYLRRIGAGRRAFRFCPAGVV